LAAAGLKAPLLPDLSFLEEDLENVHLPEKFFLLVPGASGGKHFKKWPARFYGQLACTLVAHGVTPVIIGTILEEQEACLIQQACPEALNLCGQTSLEQLVSLGRKALGVVGNDTGPFHILWLGGCPGIGLFSGASDPTNCGPLSPGSVTLQTTSLEALTPQEVWAALVPLLEGGGPFKGFLRE
jgi:ADP-heptose:LPS heptosyltransferase